MKIFLAFFAAMASVAATVAATAGEYHVAQKVQVTPGEGGFDYVAVDGANRRVYVSHGDEVVVLDADSNAVVGKIPAPQTDPSSGVGEAGRATPFAGIHHVAIAAELGRGFTSNGRAGTTTIFDLKTLEKIGEAKTGKDPNTIIYDAATKRVFAFNGASDNATVIEGNSGKVIGTIELGGRPAFATSDDKGHVFVNLIDKGMVLQIDSRNMSPGERWPVAACGGPNNETMTIDKKNGRLFVGCRPDFRRMVGPPGPHPNRVMVVLDTSNGRVVTTVPIGGNPDQADFDPGTGLVFSANGEGNITVIKQESPDQYSVLATVNTEPGAQRLAVDPKTHKIFLPNNDRGAVPAATPDNPHPSAGPARNFRVLVLEM
jgi:DNA-binding beta-propeller fold protein YncE